MSSKVYVLSTEICTETATEETKSAQQDIQVWAKIVARLRRICKLKSSD